MGLDDIAGYDAAKAMQLPNTFNTAAQPDVEAKPAVERTVKADPALDTSSTPGGPAQVEVQSMDAATIARMSGQGNGMADVLGNGGKVAPGNPLGGTPVNKHAAYSPPQPGGGRGRG